MYIPSYYINTSIYRCLLMYTETDTHKFSHAHEYHVSACPSFWRLRGGCPIIGIINACMHA